MGMTAYESALAKYPRFTGTLNNLFAQGPSAAPQNLRDTQTLIAHGRSASVSPTRTAPTNAHDYIPVSNLLPSFVALAVGSTQWAVTVYNTLGGHVMPPVKLFIA